MLPPGDILKLHIQSEAEKYLKPWWDVLVDYLIIILVMITVVCAVVGLYASGPVCIPVLRCPAQDSSLDKIATCAAVIHNSSRKGDNSFDIAVQFITNRNMLVYINSVCNEDIFWMVRFFPNLLLFILAACLVCSVLWFILNSPILEQLSSLLHQCYKHADTVSYPTSHEPNISEGAGTSQERTTLITNSTSKQRATPAACATAEDKNRLKRKLEKYVQDFEKNYNAHCPCCPNFFSVKNTYIMISVVQTAVAVVSFSLLVWLMAEKMNRQYECKIDQKISGLVYDHFVCSYSITRFYLYGSALFTAITMFHTVFNFFKLISLKWLLKTDRFDRVNSLNIESPDLKFLLNLVELSNPAYLKAFCEMYEKEIIDASIVVEPGTPIIVE